MENFTQLLTMSKQQFIPQTDENRYLNTTHKCNLTGSELSTLLYILDDWIEEHKEYNSDKRFTDDINRIYTELQSITDNYFAQHEED